MATVTTASRTDDVASLVLNSVSGLVAGEKVHVYNVGNNLDGDHILLSVTIATNTVTYADNGDDVAAYSPSNGLLIEEVTWIDADDVEVALGYAPAAASVDEAYLDDATKAANAWAWRKRHEAGYLDDNPTVAPGAAVKLGTTLYAMTLFRERGSVDSFASFQDMTITAAPGTMGQIMRLLGINRSQVA
jgi:hypothetical protein